MKSTPIILALSILLISSCQKKSEVTPSTKPAVDSNSANSIKVDSIRHDSTAQAPTSYPYTDTYYGQYNEYDSDLAPYSFTGYSTVYVQHLSATNIVISALSLGVSHSNMYYPGDIYVTAVVNDSNTYSFTVQWYYDRSDFYKCVIGSTVLQCKINQSTACAGSFGAYSGTYIGYKR